MMLLCAWRSGCEGIIKDDDDVDDSHDMSCGVRVGQDD